VKSHEFPHHLEFVEAVNRIKEEAVNAEYDGQIDPNVEERDKPEDYGETKTAVGILHEKIRRIENQLERNRLVHYKLPGKGEGFKTNPLVTDPLDKKLQPFDITTIEQRFLYPGTQTKYIRFLYPRRKALMTKIGHKCPTSGEYVIKPNMIRPNMSELGKRFLISFLAVDVVPTVSIELPTGKLQPGKAATIILFFRNPAAIPMQLVLEPRYVELEEKRKSRDENEQDTASKQMESITKLELASNKVIIPSHDELSEDMSHLYDSPKSPNDRREKVSVYAIRTSSLIALWNLGWLNHL